MLLGFGRRAGRTCYERGFVLALAMVGLAGIAIQNVNSGSVALSDSHGHSIYVCGHPEKICEQMTFDEVTRRGCANAFSVGLSGICDPGTSKR